MNTGPPQPIRTYVGVAGGKRSTRACSGEGVFRRTVPSTRARGRLYAWRRRRLVVDAGTEDSAKSASHTWGGKELGGEGLDGKGKGEREIKKTSPLIRSNRPRGEL